MDVQARIAEDVRSLIALNPATPEEHLDQIALSRALDRLDGVIRRAQASARRENEVLSSERMNAVIDHLIEFYENDEQRRSKSDVERMQRVIAYLRRYRSE